MGFFIPSLGGNPGGGQPGTVTTVNNKPANQQGNVEVVAGDINYNGINSNMAATDVQGAIDEVVTKFNSGYNASSYDRVTGELTLTKFDGTSNKLNIVDPNTFVDAQLNVGTNIVQFTKVDGGTKDVDLTPLLIANKVTFNPGNTGMVAQNVQAAIEELKGDIDLLNIADVYIVADNAELQQLIGQNVLKKCDIIYIINSENVVDYDGVDVNNGTHPVAMIFDDNATGNQLRLFSRVATVTNLIAANVSFDSNNVDGVTANNVQDAIEQVNDTARNSYNDSTYDAITGELKLIKHDGSEKTHQLATRNPLGLVDAQLAGNIITFTRENQQTFELDLKDLNLQGLIERVDLVDTKIELTKVDGTKFEVDLDPLLVADKIKYNNANSGLNAQNVQEAIDELSTKVKNGYVDSEYNPDTGILTLIKEDGTRDPHEFGSGLIKNVTYDIQTQMLNIETVDGQTLTADLTDLASKTLDNYFEGENLFDKLFITTDKPYIGNANEYIRNAGGHKQTGRRDYTSHSNGNNGYVDNLIIRLANNLATNRIMQVKYWIVEKGATVAQDNIIKEVDYQECNVEEEPSLGASARITRVPVKMKFDKPVYFIYQVYTSADMAYTSINVGNESLYLDVQNENTPLSVSILENNIGQGDGVNHSGSYAISGGSTNVRDLLNSAGTVTSVNGQSPIAGEVTVKSEHIPYDNQTSNLASDNVKGAIDELNGKFVSNVRYEVADRSLKQTKNGQESDIVTGIVTQWKDLDYVKEFANTNIVDYSKVQKNTSLNSGFEYAYNASGEWGVVTFPVTEGEQYTLLRQRQYHVRIRFEDGTGTKVGHVDSPAPANKNWHRCVFNAPVGATKGVLEVRVAQDNEKDVMILAGDQTDLTVDVNNPIPFFDNKFLQIGTEMSYAFDNSNSNLNSTTVESAIKELDGKVTNAGTVKTVNSQQADAAGNVIINSEHIRYDNTTSHLVSDNVKAAIDELKNDMALLNSSDIFIVPDNAELSTLLGQNTLNHGDLVYIIDSTDVVDFTNTNVNNGSDPVAMIYDNNITTGNKLRIFSKFSTTINISADNVSYDDTDTQLGVDNVQEAVKALNYKIGTTGVSDVVYNGDKTLTVTKNGQPTAYDLSPLVGIKTINNQAGTDGAITLSVDDTINNIQFKVAGQTFGTLDYMTEQDANDIINSFTF